MADNTKDLQGNSQRGFAAMEQDRQREIAREGGKAAHEKGTAHKFSSEEARAAGRKGGEAVSRDRAHMSAIGRSGGTSSGVSRAARSNSAASASTAPASRSGSSGIGTPAHATPSRGGSHAQERDPERQGGRKAY